MRYVLWSICAVFLAQIWISGVVLSDTVIVGSESIEFTVAEGREITVDGVLEPLVISAASHSVFLIENVDDSEKDIVGIKSEKPLGWPWENYYTSTSVTILPSDRGEWRTVEASNVTMKVEGGSVVKVAISLTESVKQSKLALWIFISIVLWFIGCLIISPPNYRL